MTTLQLGTLVVYFALVVAIGLWTKRREAVGDFLIGSRSVGTAMTTASLCAVMGGMVLGGGTEMGYEFGAGALWLTAGTAGGLVLLGIVAARIRKLADEHGFLTLSDYLFLQFDAKTGYLGALLLFVAFLFLLAAQFIVGGRLFAALTPIDYPVAVFLMGGITLAYVLLGGFKAVVRTDLLQFAVMALVFIFLLPAHIDFEQTQFDFDIGSPGPLRMIGFFLSGVAGIFVGADIWQRIYSARDRRVARNSLYLSAVVWTVMGCCLVLLGMAARDAGGLTADGALFYGLYELLPPALAGVATVAVLAALMSTIDTEVFLLSSSVAKDFVARSRELDPEGMTRVIRFAMVGVTLPAMLMAIYWPSILNALFVFLSLLIAMFPVLLVSLYRPVAPNIAFASMLTGGLLLAPAFLLGWINPDTSPLLVLAGAGAALLVGAMVSRSA